MSACTSVGSLHMSGSHSELPTRTAWFWYQASRAHMTVATSPFLGHKNDLSVFHMILWLESEKAKCCSL